MRKGFGKILRTSRKADNFSGSVPIWERRLPPRRSIAACSAPSFRALPRSLILPLSPEPFSPRTWISSRAWCSSSTSTLSASCPGSVVMTAGYAGSRSHAYSGRPGERERGSPAACDPTSPNFVPGYTLGCAPGGGALVAPYGPFTTIDSNNDAGRPVTILCKSRRKPRARVMASMPCWDTPGRAPSTPGSLMASAPARAQPTGRCRDRSRLTGASPTQPQQPVHRQRDLRLAVWKRQGIRQQLEWRDQCRFWEMAGERHREGHHRIPRLSLRQRQGINSVTEAAEPAQPGGDPNCWQCRNPTCTAPAKIHT